MIFVQELCILTLPAMGWDAHRAFSASACGYDHWTSGRLEQLQVLTMHPQYFHVGGTLTPSTKPQTYNDYLLLNQVCQALTIQVATCGFAAG